MGFTHNETELQTFVDSSQRLKRACIDTGSQLTLLISSLSNNYRRDAAVTGMHRNDWNTHSFEHEREKYNNKDKESPKNMYYVRETEAGER